ATVASIGLGGRRLRRPSRRLVVGGALLVATGAAVVAVGLAVRGGGGPAGTTTEGSTTSLATVTRRLLTSQTQVDGTLGYADASTVLLPSGTAPSALRQAEQ